MKNAIEVRCQSFTYEEGRTSILEAFNFTVVYGRVTLLSGLSGSGKSTLLSLINGIIPRMMAGTFLGEVLIDGENMVGKTMSQISRKVGSVLQNAESQIIHQVVEDEIAFGCENFGIEPEEIEKRVSIGCDLMRIDRSWKTRKLSGGQKQRLITASTLAMEPNILIFDEPLANLDQKGALELLNLLQDLARKGKAILVVEHRLDVVLPFVDDVWQLKDKKAVKIEDKKEYLESQISVIKDRKEDYVGKDTLSIRMEGVSKKFGKRSILAGVTAEIKEGERILLLGENGCGKSTLMNILARLLKADGGRIEQYLNPSLKRANKRWFQEVGLVYQNPNYQLFMPSVKEEILFGAEDSSYALDIAQKFGLTDLLDRHPHSLSEGQKRRVTIAAILAQKPKLLLLDEPTVGQDYEGLKCMVDVINEIHRIEQNTMITVTHDFRCAAALCDQVLWMEDGNIIKAGDKQLVREFFPIT